MMSAANLIAVGTNQADIASGSNRSQTNATSFALSFDEGVKAAQTLHAWSPAGLAGQGIKPAVPNDPQFMLHTAGMPEVSAEMRDLLQSAGHLKTTDANTANANEAGTRNTPATVHSSEDKSLATPLSTRDLPNSCDKIQENAFYHPAVSVAAGKVIVAVDDAIASIPAVAAVSGDLSTRKKETAAQKLQAGGALNKTGKSEQHTTASNVGQTPSDRILNVNHYVIDTAGITSGLGVVIVPDASGAKLQDASQCSGVEEKAAFGTPANNGKSTAVHSVAVGAEIPIAVKNPMNSGPNIPASSQETQLGAEAERGKTAGWSTADSNDENKVQSIAGSFASIVHAANGNAGTAPVTLFSPVAQPHMPGLAVEQKTHAGESTPHENGLTAGTNEPVGSVETGFSLGTPRMLAATPTALEVGIQSGEHGWVKVRAEVSEAGGVNASISSVSSAGQEMLHRELPAMNAFLQAEKVDVTSVVIHATHIASEDRSFGAGAGGGQAQQGRNDGGQAQQNSGRPASGSADRGAMYESISGASDDALHAAVTYSQDGSWLSVRV